MILPGSRSRLFFYLMDTGVVLAALALSSVLRTALELGRSGPDEAFAVPPMLYGIAALVWLFAFQETEVYEFRYWERFYLKLQQLLVGNLMASLLFFGILYLTFRDYSRLQAVYLIGLVSGGTVAYRVAWQVLYRRLGRRAGDTRRVVVLGTNANARRVMDKIQRERQTSLELVGCVRLAQEDEIDEALAEEALGTTDDLPGLIKRLGVNEVVIAFQWYTPAISAEISRVLLMLQQMPVNVRLAPDYSELAFSRLSTHNFGGLPLIGVREPVFSFSQRVAKRLFDVCLAGLVLALLWPVYLSIALAIRLDSPGPVILRQQRVGTYGKLFTMYKFRSMAAGIDQNQFDETELNIIKQPDDPRVTRTGRWLRRTSLDELPQFFNVLLGDMSIVGPRPEVPERVQQYQWWQFKRFEVPQGMTGWWQVNGRANRPMHLHTEDDLYYIQNYSLWLDIKIIVRTFRVVITGQGAF